MARQLKIVIVCYASYGGSGIVATELGLALAERGHKIFFVSTDIPKRLELGKHENIKLYIAEPTNYALFDGPLTTTGMTGKLAEVLLQEQPDIVNVHYAIPFAMSAIVARDCVSSVARLKKLPKVIVTLHGTDVTVVGNDRACQMETLHAVVSSDGVTVPSAFLANAAHDKLRIPSEKVITVIPNFVDAEEFKPLTRPAQIRAARCELNLTGKKKPLLVHASNFRVVKRIGDVIAAFKLVREQRDSHLVLIGDGPERERMEKLVESYSLTNDVTFAGWQRRIGAILGVADVFLLPSESESFGLAALEAMSCGVPVVATQVGGLPEVVTHGETGFLADPGDVGRMAEYCLRIIGDKETKERFSANARQCAVEQFSKKEIVSQYEEFFLSTLDN